MVDENRSVATRIDGEIRQANEEMAALREELADTSRRFEEHLSSTNGNNNINNNRNHSGASSAGNGTKASTSESSEVSSAGQTITSTSSTEHSVTKCTNLNGNCSSPLKIKLDNLSPTRVLETEFPLSQTNGDDCVGEKDIGVELNRCQNLALELEEDLELINGESKVDVKQLIRPPSPIPGPSNKPDFGKS